MAACREADDPGERSTVTKEYSMQQSRRTFCASLARWSGIASCGGISIGAATRLPAQVELQGDQNFKILEEELPPKNRFYLYLLMGQENMAGRGVVTAEDRELNKQIIRLNEYGNWVPAGDPVHFDNPRIVGVGPGMTFARYMEATVNQKRTNPEIKITVGLVPCAQGGTSLEQWEKGGDRFAESLKRAKIAMKHGTLKGILWHHGEFDARIRTKAVTYAPRLQQMVIDFRLALGHPRVPFVAAKLPPYLRPDVITYAGLIDEAIDELCKTQPMVASVEATGLTGKRDRVHFNAASARELGRRYAKIMLKLDREQAAEKNR